MSRSQRPPKDELYELYWGQQLSMSELADTYDVTKRTVRRWFKQHGMQTIPNACHEAWVFQQLSKQRLYELYWVEMLSHREIAERYDVSKHLVHETFQDTSIPVFNSSTHERVDGIPRPFRWPSDDAPNSQDDSLPDDPDPSKYLVDTPMDKDRLYELHWTYGCSVMHISAMSDMDEDTVRRRMESYGVPIRTWRTHTSWEPHHGVPPKYEWPPEWDERDNMASSDYNGVQWRTPEAGD